MSGDNSSVRFWRKQKLGSRDFTLRENRETGEGEGEGDGSIRQGASTEYRTYKRRWFGLAQLTLMNIIVSWDVRLKFQQPTQSRHIC
jgi:FLVCR family MFS transporter 7